MHPARAGTVSHVRAAVLLLPVALWVASCTDDRDSDEAGNVTTASTASAPASPAAVSSTAPGGVPHPCGLLTASDFANARVAVEGPGVDLSDQLALATTTSAACQWRGDGTWDLLVGSGGGANAYEFDRGFFDELDVVADLDAGDAGYILDREQSATPEDYDHEAGVLIGDVYFTLGTTDDDGARATRMLALAIADRLAASG
jgi:hypothetical protein